MTERICRGKSIERDESGVYGDDQSRVVKCEEYGRNESRSEYSRQARKIIN
jgi:hypothetical protein